MLNVMEPRLAECANCGQRHSSMDHCWQQWTDAEFVKFYPPGSFAIAFRSGEIEPVEVKILTAACRGVVFVEVVKTGERHKVYTGRFVARQSERVEDISVEISTTPQTQTESDPMVATATAKRSTTKSATSSSSMMTKTKAKSTRVDPAHVAGTAAAQQLLQVPIGDVVVVRNDREAFDPDELKQLASSIGDVGLITPLDVVPLEGQPGKYELVAGERRLRACRIAKLQTVPCIVSEVSPLQRSMRQLDENLQRVDLNAIEKAAAIKHRMETFGLTQKEMAKRLNCNQSQISNQVRLLELPELWQQWIATGKLAPTSVRALIPFAAKRPQVLQWLVDKHATSIDDGGFELADWMVGSAVRSCTRPLDQSRFFEYSKPDVNTCWFDSKKLSPSVIKELDVESIDGEDRAWNVSQWNECNAEDFARVKLRYATAAKKRSKFTTERTKGDDSESKIDRQKLNNATTDVFATILRSKLDIKLHGPMLPALMCVLNYQDLGYNVACAISKDRLHGVSHNPAALAEHLATLPAKEQTKIVFDAIKSELSADADYFVDISELMPIATLLKIDLRSHYRPNRQTLELFPGQLLRTYGMKLCGIKQADQPDTLEGVLDWLEEDWPEGVLPAEVAELLQ